jgi:hypothetical protein
VDEDGNEVNSPQRYAEDKKPGEKRKAERSPAVETMGTKPLGKKQNGQDDKLLRDKINQIKLLMINTNSPLRICGSPAKHGCTSRDV